MGATHRIGFWLVPLAAVCSLGAAGDPPLVEAVKKGDAQAVRSLLKDPKTVNVAAVDGTTALHWAAHRDDVATTQLLIGAGADVKTCVELGADVNAANDTGETALHGVAYRGVNTVAEYLVEKGARLDAKDKRGWTALMIASGLSYSDTYKEQKHTAELLARLMKERGLSTDNGRVDPSVCLDCLQTRSALSRAEAERDRRMEAEFAARDRSQQQP